MKRKEHLLLREIRNRLYIARNITLDNVKILSCLADLDSLYNAEYNDCNGERTDAEMKRNHDACIDKLLEKYK